MKALEQEGWCADIDDESGPCQLSEIADVDPFRREERDRASAGVLDTLGGAVVIESAYRFVLHKVRTQGTKFVLGA